MQPYIVKVDVWFDFVCPWCWIGKRRFEDALKRYPYKDYVEVTYRTYRIAIGSKPEIFPSAVAKKFGDPSKAALMMQAIKDHGEPLGLIYDFENTWFGDTADAHVLVKSIQDRQLQANLIERMYEGVFTNGVSIFNKKGLEKICDQAGISSSAVEYSWNRQQLHEEVERDEVAAQEYGRGVPLYIFNSTIAVSGAQPPEVFLDALNALPVPVGSIDDYAAPSCGLNGCK